MNQQVRELTASFNEETNKIAAKLDKFIADNANDVDDAQIAELTAVRDRLRSVASDPENPLPPEA